MKKKAPVSVYISNGYFLLNGGNTVQVRNEMWYTNLKLAYTLTKMSYAIRDER